MKANQTSNKPLNLNEKLDRHFLSCSAFVGAAMALAGTQQGQAEIIYSGIQNIPVPSTNGAGGIYLDLNNGAFINQITNGSSSPLDIPTLIPGWDINIYARNNAAQRSIRSYFSPTTYAVYQNFSGNNRISVLGAGTIVDSSSSFGSFGGMAQQGFGEWNNTNGFMGIQMTNSVGTTVYGWIRLQTGPGEVDGDGDPFNNGGPGFPATIVDWAWENSGGSIAAGAVPEPSAIALGCLAVGALGVRAWRSRKKA